MSLLEDTFFKVERGDKAWAVRRPVWPDSYYLHLTKIKYVREGNRRVILMSEVLHHDSETVDFVRYYRFTLETADSTLDEQKIDVLRYDCWYTKGDKPYAYMPTDPDATHLKELLEWAKLFVQDQFDLPNRLFVVPV